MLEMAGEGALTVLGVPPKFGGGSNPFRPDGLIVPAAQLYGVLAKGLHPLDTCRR